MRKLIGGMAAVAVLISLPAVADAQRRAAARPAGGARHEFGVDLGIAYTKFENVDGGLEIGTPLDVRVGLMSTGKMMWEPRFALGVQTWGGSTRYSFTPGVNVLVSNSPGGHRRGMYLTGGAGLVLMDNGANNGTAFALNAGVGWRKPYGSGAWRYELGFKYTSEMTDLGIPSEIQIGARLGISLWH